jgi:hypothetical protein
VPQRAVKEPASRAGLAKRITCHTFRHSFATHLLEGGYEIQDIYQTFLCNLILIRDIERLDMKKPVFILTLILMPFISSCVHTDCVQRATIDKYRTFLVSEFAKACWDFDLFNGDSVEYIKKKLGAPISEKIEYVKNIYDDEQIDQIHILKYQGLEIQVLHVNRVEPDDLLIGVKITNSDNYPIKFGIKIGSERSYVLDLLGKPSDGDGVIKYYTEVGDTYPRVHMFFEKDKLKEIQWEWLPD